MKSIKHAKKFYDLPTPRHTAVMEEIENEKQADRAVAIVGAAYVDLVLRDAISTKLLRDEELMALLFENRGPLQEFGSRIQMTYALGLCGRAAYDDLRTIKSVRNAFAHSAEPIDFQHQDVARFCAALWYPKRIHVKNRPDPQTPREQYVRAIALITDMFHSDFMRRQRGMLGDPHIMAPGPSAQMTVAGSSSKISNAK
jgi:DNA-binding MltR family transcriptional regulator